MDDLTLVAIAAAVVTVVALVVLFSRPLGGDRRHGGKESDYAGNQPTAGEGGD